MTSNPQHDLLDWLKALADEQRLSLLALLHAQPRTLAALAAELKQAPAALAPHISALHEAGFLNVFMAGAERVFHLNQQTLARFKAEVNRIESIAIAIPVPVSDNAWIEALDWTEAEKQVLRDYTFDGRITDLPPHDSDLAILLRYYLRHFEAGKRYSEQEVNRILSGFYADYATLRRCLIEFGMLQRESSGASYWLPN